MKILHWKSTVIILFAFLPLFVSAQKKEGNALADSFVIELSKTADDTNKVNILNNVANIYTNDADGGVDLDKGLKYAQQALVLAGKLQYKKGLSAAYNITSIVYAMRSDFSQATAYDKMALKIATDIQDKRLMANSYYAIGTMFYYTSNYPDALTNYFSALKINEELGAKKAVAGCYTNIGNIYESQKKSKEALGYYAKAINIYSELGGNEHSKAILLQNTAGVYYDDNNYTEALNNYKAGLKLYEETKDKRGMAGCYMGFGNIYDDEKNYAIAQQNFTVALKLSKEADDKSLIARTLSCIAECFVKTKEYAEAERYAKEALEIAGEAGILELTSRANEVLSEAYAHTGDYKKALESYKAFVTAKDSIFNEQAANNILQAQLQYDFDKKEAASKADQDKKSVVLQLKLQQKNIFIYGVIAAFILLFIISILIIRQNKLKTNQQKAELEQRQLRAQMNPHFIFNCLNSIQHFIVANDVKNANKYLSGFALLMRQTLENSKEGTITLRREIEYLENYLVLETMRFEDKFTYEVVCAADVNKDSVEIPSMIVQPFIENAIRHGLCYLEGNIGKLMISFFIRSGYLYCIVDDNGIGRERSHKLKLDSDMVYESQGMELTRRRLALVSKSAGAEYKIEITDKVNIDGQPGGTTVTLKFPLDA